MSINYGTPINNTSKGSQDQPHQNTGLSKYPPVSSIRIQQPTEHLGCIPDPVYDIRFPKPLLSTRQRQNLTSSRAAKMNHATPSSGFASLNSFGDSLQTLEHFPRSNMPDESYYFASSYSSCAAQAFEEPDNSPIELQLRGELRACEEEIKRLKKENLLYRGLDSVELLQAAAEWRVALTCVVSNHAGSSECIVELAGQALGVQLGYSSGLCAALHADEQHGPSEPAVLEASARDGTPIRSRLLDHHEVQDSLLEKYITTCEEKLCKNLRLLNGSPAFILQDFVAAAEAAVQSLTAVSSHAAPKFDLNYMQLLRLAFLWKLRYKECVQKVNEAIESSRSVHNLYASALKSLLPLPTTSADATQVQGNSPCPDVSMDASEDVKSSLESMAELKQELKKMPWKARVTHLHSSLQAELDYAKKAHIVTEALVACQREAKERIQRIEHEQPSKPLLWEQLGDGWEDQRDYQERDAAQKSLSLLDYVRRSRLGVIPNNVKAAVVFDVLKELRELHLGWQVYRWLNPVNIVAQDGFKLRTPSELSTTEPLPPWRFLAPELLPYTDQTSSISSTSCKATASCGPQHRLSSNDDQEVGLGEDEGSNCRRTSQIDCSYELEPGELSESISLLGANVETSKPGSVGGSVVFEKSTIDSACDVYSFGQVVLWLLCLDNSTDFLIDTLTSSMTAVPILNRVFSKDQLARPSIDELLELEWFGEKLSKFDESSNSSQFSNNSNAEFW